MIFAFIVEFSFLFVSPGMTAYDTDLKSFPQKEQTMKTSTHDASEQRNMTLNKTLSVDLTSKNLKWNQVIPNKQYLKYLNNYNINFSFKLQYHSHVTKIQSYVSLKLKKITQWNRVQNKMT